MAEDVLQGDSVGSEFRYTLSKLLNSHLILIEVEAEGGLVINISFSLNIKRFRARNVKLFGD
jgi:hypothetical protein